MTKPAPNPYRGNPLLGERPKRALTREDEHKRFLALFEHYGISDPQNDPYAAIKLAYSLARTFVPGFQPERRRGVKEKWDAFERVMILQEYCRIQNEFPQKGDIKILQEMAGYPDYQERGLTYNALKSIIRRTMHSEKRDALLSAIQTLLECLAATSRQPE
jgi:hypothetical protein